jgi:hypothetical protein
MSEAECNCCSIFHCVATLLGLFQGPNIMRSGKCSIYDPAPMLSEGYYTIRNYVSKRIIGEDIKMFV